MIYSKEIISIRNKVANFSVKQDIDINIHFISLVNQFIHDKSIVIDIGTGNGFILSQILKNSTTQAVLFGIDNSKEMISVAQDNLRNYAQMIEADIKHLPFEKCCADIITAKNVTRINTAEIYRVLKKQGVFIFREYGYGKGMIEITELFQNRIIRQRRPDYYIDNLQNNGLEVIRYDQYLIKRNYDSAEELVSIVNSFPFIKDFSKHDESIILKKFAQKSTITSDPFILVAIKPKGSE